MSDPSTDQVTIGDYQQIAQLLTGYRNQNNDANFWLERFHFWWDGNPFFEPSMNRGWVLRHEGRVVGFIGRIPMPFWLDGKEYMTFSPVSWFVLPEYYGNGLSLFLNYMNDTSHAIQWNTTGNSRTREIFIKLRFQKIPYLYNSRFMVFTNWTAYLYEMAIRNNWSKRVQWLLYDINKKWPGSKRHFAVEGMRLLRLHYADARFDRLWERTKHKIMATKTRSAMWLNWYCFGWRSRPKILFGCFQGEELEGFAVFQPRVVHDGLFWECLDVWIDPALSYCGDALFAFALTENEKQGGKGLISHDYPAVRGWLDRQFWTNQGQGNPDGFFNGPKKMCRLVQQGSHFFSLGEGDQGM